MKKLLMFTVVAVGAAYAVVRHEERQAHAEALAWARAEAADASDAAPQN